MSSLRVALVLALLIVPTAENAAAQTRDPLSAAISDYLRPFGFNVLGVRAREGRYSVALAEPDSGDGLFLVPVRYDDTSYVMLTERGLPLVHGIGPGDKVEWLRLGGASVDALRIAINDPVDHVVGTTIFRISNGALEHVWQDDTDVCVAGELADLDGDGRRELSSYTGDPSGGDCTHPCHLILMDQVHVQIGWIRVHRWVGEEWSLAEGEFPEFYRARAELYDRAARWISSGDRDHPCQAYWLSVVLPLFTRWAERAERIADGR